MHSRWNPNPRVALVVDDDDLVLEATACLLEDLGFRTYSELDGQRALDRLRQESDISLLLTDFRMPGMSGAELIGHALQERPQLHAILVSAYLEEVPPVGENVVVLRKPYSKADLIQVVGSSVSIA